MSEIETNDGDEIELRTGREGPAYTEVHDWVALSGASPTAGFLYNLLRMHVNRKRGDKYVWLSTLTLAILCSLSRGDKLKPYLDELEKLGAIDVERSGLHRRNIYTVHSLPPAGYRGSLDIKEWHEQNKPMLDGIRAAEKAKRDARRAKARAGKGQVNPVTPGRGEQAVTPQRGEPVTPDSGEPVTPSRGREPKEGQPKEVEPSVPPSEVRRRASEESIQDSKANGSGEPVQTTLTGEDESLAEKPSTPEQVAFKIARDWMAHRASLGAPIAGGNSLHQLRSLLLPFLKVNYTEIEIKKALNGLRKGIPAKTAMDDALLQIRTGQNPGRAGSAGRRGPVVDVNEAWADKAPQYAKAASTGGGGW